MRQARQDFGQLIEKVNQRDHIKNHAMSSGKENITFGLITKNISREKMWSKLGLRGEAVP